MTKDQMPVQSGDRAPDFVVPAVHEDRTISLADYRGRTPVPLGLFRGLYCPFCRRAMAQMAATSRPAAIPRRPILSAIASLVFRNFRAPQI